MAINQNPEMVELMEIIMNLIVLENAIDLADEMITVVMAANQKTTLDERKVQKVVNKKINLNEMRDDDQKIDVVVEVEQEEVEVIPQSEREEKIAENVIAIEVKNIEKKFDSSLYYNIDLFTQICWI